MKEFRIREAYKIKCKCPMCEKLYIKTIYYEWLGRGLYRKYCDTCEKSAGRRNGLKVGHEIYED